MNLGFQTKLATYTYLTKLSGPTKFCLAVLICTTMIWIIGSLDSRYDSYEERSLGRVFPTQLERWQGTGGLEGIELAANNLIVTPELGRDSGGMLLINLSEDTRASEYHLVRIRSIVHTIVKASLPKRSTDAGILLRYLNSENKAIHWSWASRLTGHTKIHRAEHIAPLEDDAQSIKILFSNRSSTGSFELKQLDVDLVKVSKIYLYLFLPMLIICWAILVYTSFAFMASHLGPFKVMMFVLVVLGLLVGILISNEIRDLIIQPILLAATQALKPILSHASFHGLSFDEVSLIIYYKLGHFLAFFCITSILYLNLNHLPISQLHLLIVLVLIAVATEGAQLHLFSRSTQLLDVIIDVFGILLAIAVSAGIKKSYRKMRI